MDNNLKREGPKDGASDASSAKRILKVEAKKTEPFIRPTKTQEKRTEYNLMRAAQVEQEKQSQTPPTLNQRHVKSVASVSRTTISSRPSTPSNTKSLSVAVTTKGKGLPSFDRVIKGNGTAITPCKKSQVNTSVTDSVIPSNPTPTPSASTPSTAPSTPIPMMSSGSKGIVAVPTVSVHNPGGSNVNFKLQLNVNYDSSKKGNVNVHPTLSKHLDEVDMKPLDHKNTPKKKPKQASASKHLPPSSPEPRSMTPETSNRDAINHIRKSLQGSPYRKEVMETTSAIQVAVRVRPFFQSESSEQVVNVHHKENNISVNHQQFQFNHVFDSIDRYQPMACQEVVYKTLASPLLDHVLTGYNACLFAYGQTGSGKTYSMNGTEIVDKLAERGIIPRLVEDLFHRLAKDGQVRMTYIEIYNECIFNLLPSSEPQLGKKSLYKVREHSMYGPYVENLNTITVHTPQDLISLWSLGNINRHKAATNCNHDSSRSHAILQIIVDQKYDDDTVGSLAEDCDSTASDGERLSSIINLVDLAGSERVAQTGTTGDRFKEGTHINKSLFTLGRVISELSSLSDNGLTVRSKRKHHICYRDSTLTFLLNESLGGNSRTVMLATVSPSATHLEETVSTLRYASKAQRIVNHVRVNEDPKLVRIRMLENECARLQMLVSKYESDMKMIGSNKMNSLTPSTTPSQQTASPMSDSSHYQSFAQPMDTVKPNITFCSATPAPDKVTSKPNKKEKKQKQKQNEQVDQPVVDDWIVDDSWPNDKAPTPDSTKTIALDDTNEWSSPEGPSQPVISGGFGPEPVDEWTVPLDTPSSPTKVNKQDKKNYQKKKDNHHKKDIKGDSGHHQKKDDATNKQDQQKEVPVEVKDHTKCANSCLEDFKSHALDNLREMVDIVVTATSDADGDNEKTLICTIEETNGADQW